MVDLAAGGKDVNSVAADALGLLVKSPGVAILLSTFAKMTLDIMQTPIREQIQDWQNQDMKEMNRQKFGGLKGLRTFFALNKVKPFFIDYEFKNISYQSMQDILSGKLKKWKDLQYTSDEVTLLYKYVENEDIFIIDAFFINTKE